MESTIASIPHATPVPGTALDTRPVADVLLALIWITLTTVTGLMLFGYSRDYFEYLIYYQSIPKSLSFLDTRFEPGFHVIAWFFRNYLDADLSTLSLTLAAVSLAIKFMLFRRYLAHPVFAAILYAVLFFPIHEYTQYRVGIALAFGFWAVHLLIERRYAWSAILFCLAFSLHYSSSLLLVGAGLGLYVRSRLVVAGTLAVIVIATVFSSLNYAFEDVLNSLNPLSAAYLQNSALIESVSILSVNNLLIVAALACYLAAGYHRRGGYHVLMLTMSIACLVPIVLLPDAPVVAQRSKEVLFPAIIFLSCRSRWTMADLPGLGFVIITTALLGYLWIDGGIITL